MRTSPSRIVNDSPSQIGSLFRIVIHTSVSSDMPGGGPLTPSNTLYLKQTSFGLSDPSCIYINEPSELIVSPLNPERANTDN